MPRGLLGEALGAAEASGRCYDLAEPEPTQARGAGRRQMARVPRIRRTKEEGPGAAEWPWPLALWGSVHLTGRRSRLTEPGSSLSSFLKAGTSAVWETQLRRGARRECNLEITLAGAGEAGGPAGEQADNQLRGSCSEPGEGPARPGVYMLARLFGACKSVSDVNGTASFFCRGGIPRDVWMGRPAGLGLGKAGPRPRREVIRQAARQPGRPTQVPLSTGLWGYEK